MYRTNSSNSRTQTTTFNGSSNILGSSTNNTNTNITTNSTTLQSGRNGFRDNTLFAIITSNLAEVKRLVNLNNSNDIIDIKNNFTALHHAVRIKGNDEIIEYLMSIGANPKLKQNENKDAIDLAIDSNYRFLIDKLLNINEVELNTIHDKLDTINYEHKKLKIKNEELVEENGLAEQSEEIRGPFRKKYFLFNFAQYQERA